MSKVVQGDNEVILFCILGMITLVPMGTLVVKYWSSLSQARRVAAMSAFIGLSLIWLDLWLDKAWVGGIGKFLILLCWFLVIRDQNRQLLEEEGDSRDAFVLYQRSKYYLAIALLMAILLSTIFLLKHFHLLR